jgi:uncharacterized protein (DUF433 family)
LWGYSAYQGSNLLSNNWHFTNAQIGAIYEGIDREQVKAAIEFAVRSLDRLPEHPA